MTRPFLPSLDGEVLAILREAWDRGWITNDGPVLRRLEVALGDRWGVDTVAIANGTVALQIGAVALGLRGRVLTTPFTFPATSAALAWQGCEPVLADIDPETWNVDPARLAAALDGGVSGIVATHVFGNPCDVVGLGALARESGAAVMYDAAHAVDVEVGGRSVLAWGDVSALSFHATKVFHTVEGGGLASPRPELVQRIRALRNFGSGATAYAEPGINGKVSEVHAAVGLAVLSHLDRIVARRRELCRRYRQNLAGHVRFQRWAAGSEPNGAYQPVLFADETSLLRAVERLGAMDVQPRRYFHPSLSELPWLAGQPMPIAEEVARTVLCLPLYFELTERQVDDICEAVVARG